MTCYSYGQLEALWISAGGNSAVAPVAAAIALAESGGCTTAMNYTDNNGTQTSVGIWQVSNGTHSYPSAWTTAAGNAAEAVAKYNAAGGFSPWGTYDSGAYKTYLNTSSSPDYSGVGTGADLTSAETTSADASCAWTFPGVDLGVGTLGGGCVISKSQLRAIIGVSIFLGGMLVGAVGLAVLVAGAFAGTGAGKQAAKGAGTAATLAGQPELAAAVDAEIAARDKHDQREYDKAEKRSRSATRTKAEEFDEVPF